MSNLKKRLISFLRWSEKYTKTDMVYLASRSGLSIIAQGVTALATLSFAIIVGHYLPKETYGEYKYVLSIISILSLFSLNSIGGAVMQSTAQGYSGTLQKGFRINLRWSFAVFSGALVLAIYYFFSGNAQLAAEVLIGGSLSPLLASASLYSPFLAGKKDFIRQMLYSIIDNLFTTGVMIVTVLLTHNPLVLIGAYFVVNIIGAFYFYRRTEILYASAEEKHDESMLTYSKHLSVIGIIGGISDMLDQILVFHFAGAAQLAIFAFATALPDQVRTPQKMLAEMVQTRFVSRTVHDIKSGISNKFFWYFIFSLSIVVSYIILAPFIFKLLFPSYMASVFYSQIYALSILAVTFDPASIYLSSRRKVKEFYINSIFHSSLHIIAMIIGMLWWGVLGLVVAQVVSRLAGALLIYYLYRKAIRHELSHA